MKSCSKLLSTRLYKQGKKKSICSKSDDDVFISPSRADARGSFSHVIQKAQSQCQFHGSVRPGSVTICATQRCRRANQNCQNQALSSPQIVRTVSSRTSLLGRVFHHRQKSELYWSRSQEIEINSTSSTTERWKMGFKYFIYFICFERLICASSTLRKTALWG